MLHALLSLSVGWYVGEGPGLWGYLCLLGRADPVGTPYPGQGSVLGLHAC
jgi:hypothetical protein